MRDSKRSAFKIHALHSLSSIALSHVFSRYSALNESYDRRQGPAEPYSNFNLNEGEMNSKCQGI